MTNKILVPPLGESVTEATVSVSKINPPIGGDVEKVTIVLTEAR